MPPKKKPSKLAKRRQPAETSSTGTSSTLGAGEPGDIALICIHFGPEYSSVAWRVTCDSDKTNSQILTNWPNSFEISDRVPSVLAYNEKDSSDYKWGFEVAQHDPARLELFRLLLDIEGNPSRGNLLESITKLHGYADNQKGLQRLRNTIQTMPEEKDPSDLASDYLRGIYKHIRMHLQKIYPASIFERLTMIVYLTIPPDCTDTGKSLLLTAAIKAGLSEDRKHIELITETEAVALHYVNNMNTPPKADSIYVIVSCDERNTKVVSYHLLATEPVFKLKECGAVVGQIHGSDAIIHRFETFMKARLGQLVYDSKAGVRARCHFEELCLPFIGAMMGIDGELDTEMTPEFYVPVPGVQSDNSNGVIAGLMAIKCEEMRGFFEPTLNRISSAVQEAISTAEGISGKEVQAVILWASRFRDLNRWIADNVRNRRGKEVKVFQQDSYWTSLVHGAAAHGMMMYKLRQRSSQRVARRTRFHYGICVSEPFIAGTHPIEKLYVDPYDGIPMCSGRIQWFVHKGEEIFEDFMSIHFNYRYTPISESDLQIENYIFFSSADIPPLDIEHPNTSLLATVKLDLSSVSSHLFVKREQEAGGNYLDIPVFITFLMGPCITINWGIGFDSIVVGEAVMDYHHDSYSTPGKPLVRCSCSNKCGLGDPPEGFSNVSNRGHVTMTGEKPSPGQYSTVHELLSIICRLDQAAKRFCGLRKLITYLSEDELSAKDADGNTVLHVLVRYGNATDEKPELQLQLLETIAILLKRFSKLLEARNSKLQSPYIYRLNTLEQPRQEDKVDGESDTLHFQEDLILEYLKDECVRRPDAGLLLYGDTQPHRQLSLNLEELAASQTPLNQEMLFKLFNQLTLESILRFVYIPQLQFLDTNGSPATTQPALRVLSSRTSETIGKGQNDYVQLLKYLHSQCHVRKIIELRVDDSLNLPHSDKDIASLGVFEIENFDWRKIDLCSETIFKAAPNARKITLYSSGHNAVLRSCSAHDGLAKFTKLRHVHVVLCQTSTIESSTALEENLVGFQERMALNCEKVLVTIEKSTATPQRRDIQDVYPAQMNTWLDIMQKFAGFLTSQPTHMLDPNRRPIKVAILDDGIDVMLRPDGYCAAIAGGQSFKSVSDPNSKGSPSAGYEKPYWLSSCGQGTLMAELILRVAPQTQLYIARLDDMASRNTDQYATLVVKALRWATQQGVDIILMTSPIPTSTHETTMIQSEISESDTKSLIFAPSWDPAHLADIKPLDGIFYVNAANYGRSRYIPNKHSATALPFVFPSGHSCSLRATELADIAAPESAWGGPCAAALAAGMAALILDCAEIARYGGADRDVLTTNWKLILNEMACVTPEGRYVQVERYFTEKISSADWLADGPGFLKNLVDDILSPIHKLL